MELNFDVFFYYGLNDIAIENESDLMTGLLTPKRSLFYNRNDGCGISEYENAPNSLSTSIQIRFDIAKWVSSRNTYVSDGRNQLMDRRIAVSQNSINIEQDPEKGTVDIDVLYISFQDYTNPSITSLQLGILR